MRFSIPGHTSLDDPVSEIVARLWQTKLRSISLLEDWLPRASDFSIRAGLHTHLGDERRHQRILGNEITRRGGRRGAAAVGQVLDRPFDLVRSQPDDLSRLRLYHQGIKKITVQYCDRILPFLDPALAQVVEQITRDEARHVRWAEIRLAQVARAGGRTDRPLQEIEAAMEAVWSKPWRRMTMSGYVGKAG